MKTRKVKRPSNPKKKKAACRASYNASPAGIRNIALPGYLSYLVTRLPGYRVTWLPGYPGYPGYLVTQLPSYPVTSVTRLPQLPGYLVTWLPSYLVTYLVGTTLTSPGCPPNYFLVTRLPGYPVPGYLVTRYPVTWLPSYLVTQLPGYLVT